MELTVVVLSVDRERALARYATAGIRRLPLIDPSHGDWSLHTCPERVRYRTAANGAVGEDIPFPAPFGRHGDTSRFPCYRTGR